MTYNKFFSRVFLLVLILGLASCSSEGGSEGDSGNDESGDGSVKLALNLKKGDKFDITNSTVQNIEQTIMGQNQKSEVESGMTYKYEVTDVDKNGTASIKVTYKWIKIRQKAGFTTSEYDSKTAGKDDPVPPFATVYAALVGKSFTMKMDKKGEVTDVKGMDKVIDGIMEQEKLIGKPEEAKVRESLEKEIGSDAIKETLGSAHSFFPKKAIKVGDKWSDEQNISAGFPLKIKTDYTFKEEKDGLVIITSESKISLGDGDKTMDNGMAKITYDEFSGTQKGVTKVDKKTGWVMESTVDQDLDGKMTMEGGMFGKMTIPMNIKSKITSKTEK